MAPILPLPIILNGLTKSVKFNTVITQLGDDYQQIRNGGKPEITWQMSTNYSNYALLDQWVTLIKQYGGYQEFDLNLDFLGTKTFRCQEFSKEYIHHDYGQLSLSLIQS